MGKYFDPLADWSFKQLFGSEPNKEILIEFLNDPFKGEKVITEVVYSPNEHNGRKSSTRKVLFDLLCTGNKGEWFIVEMQRGYQDFFRERSVFYMYHGQLANSFLLVWSITTTIFLKYTLLPSWNSVWRKSPPNNISTTSV